MQRTNVPPMPWVRSGTGEPLHPQHLPAWRLQPQNLLFDLSAPGLFSSASISGKGSIPLPYPMYWGQPSREGAQEGLPGCQELAGGDDPRANTACFPPPPRAEAAPPRMAHPITSTPTCPGWSAACLQQLNFAKMVKPVSINPDPNRVFFMTEATA